MVHVAYAHAGSHDSKAGTLNAALSIPIYGAARDGTLSDK